MDESQSWDLIFEHVGWGIVVADAQTHELMKVNPAYAEMHGYSVEEMQEINLAEIFSDEDRALLLARAAEVHETGRLVYESIHVRKDGRLFPVLTNVQTIYDEQGQVKYRVASCHDITERKKAEEALLLTQISVDSLTDAVYWMGPDARFTYVNDAAVEALGYSREELLTMTVHDIGPEFPAEVWPEHWAELKEKKSFFFQTLHQRKDATMFPVEITVNFVQLGGKEINCAIAKDITERRQAEEKLNKARILLESSIESAKGMIIFAIDTEFRYLYFNHAHQSVMKSIYGTDVGIGTNILDYITADDDREKARKYYDQVLSGESLTTIEEWGKEERSYYEILFTPIEPVVDKILGITVFARDISERILAEKALKSTESRLRSITESSSEHIMVVDPDLTIQFINRTIPEFTVDQVIGRKVVDFSTEDSGELSRERYESVFRTGKPAFYQTSYVTKNDDEIIFDVRISPMLIDGQVVSVVSSLRDITERQKIEEQLQQSEQSFRDLVETSQDLIFKCDDEGRFTYLNPMWEITHGYPLDEMLGRSFTEFVHPDRAEKDFAEFNRHLEGGSVSGYEDTHISKTGEEIHLVFDVVPIRDGDGTIVGTQGTAHDVTRRKLVEEEKLSLERQMLQAQKLESLGILAGGIAHDFNNLLMTVLGNADIALQDLSRHSPARSSIETIVETAHKAAGLSKQMLAYSGKGSFVIEPIELNMFVEEMAHLLDVSISKKTVLKYNFADNLPIIKGDATQIRQIIMNLIINASEAIADRSGVICLSTGALECDQEYLSIPENMSLAGLDESLPEGVFVYLEVADTGCGMDKETQSKLFDPFFTTKFTGRGLGMAATLGIVRGHHGMIKIYSEIGQGTTIKVLFPATELEVPGPGDFGDVEAPDDWHGEGMILIADDEETVCAVTKQYLERLGFEVITARDGREAIDLFREHSQKIVCVLLDMTMPHVDGKEAFREMRRIRKDATVILCSGYSEQDATQHFVGKGLAGFLQKPYRSAALREKLIEVLT